jgi:hypothetical protein
MSMPFFVRLTLALTAVFLVAILALALVKLVAVAAIIAALAVAALYIARRVRGYTRRVAIRRGG